MPNGVICGGAVDGSNQLGEIVTCQAMTACPDGARSAAMGAVAPETRIATSKPINATRDRRLRNKVISRPPPEVEDTRCQTAQLKSASSRKMIVRHFGLFRQ